MKRLCSPALLLVDRSTRHCFHCDLVLPSLSFHFPLLTGLMSRALMVLISVKPNIQTCLPSIRRVVVDRVSDGHDSRTDEVTVPLFKAQVRIRKVRIDPLAAPEARCAWQINFRAPVGVF